MQLDFFSYLREVKGKKDFKKRFGAEKTVCKMQEKQDAFSGYISWCLNSEDCWKFG